MSGVIWESKPSANIITDFNTQHGQLARQKYPFSLKLIVSWTLPHTNSHWTTKEQVQ